MHFFDSYYKSMFFASLKSSWSPTTNNSHKREINKICRSCLMEKNVLWGIFGIWQFNENLQ